jgi:hypothetical protein
MEICSLEKREWELSIHFHENYLAQWPHSVMFPPPLAEVELNKFYHEILLEILKSGDSNVESVSTD